MSAAFFVYTHETGGRDESGARPHVYEADRLAEALAKFLREVTDGEWAELVWSS